jgi:DNA-binding CsgD family transcriptional regulator
MIKRSLTEHERVILEYSEGRTAKETATELDICEQTVKSTLNRIYMKFGVANKERALTLAKRRGLLPFIGTADVR